MKIIKAEKVDLNKYGKYGYMCNVYVIHVKVDDVSKRAEEMIKIISDTSWINGLDAIDKVAFDAKTRRTIDKLVKDIFAKVDDVITSEFGEYMVSDTAQCSLEREHSHVKVPLMELLKEKVSGNPGFDFHTESDSNLIVFGEAKYNGTINPYKNAMTQIVDFIGNRKDLAELDILRKFVSASALTNILNGEKAYVAAFSLNANNPCRIFNNALRSDEINPLLEYHELYLIGVEA